MADVLPSVQGDNGPVEARPVVVVDSTGAIVGGAVQKAEDSPHTSGDPGNYSLGTRQDSPLATAGTSGDYQGSAYDAFGGIWAALESGGVPVSFAGITSNFRLLSAVGTQQDAANVKASNGFLFKIMGRNNRASSVFLKLYNKASTPVVGTDVPFATFELAASLSFDIRFEPGLFFSAGIGFGLTTAAADNSVASVTAGDITALNIMST